MSAEQELKAAYAKLQELQPDVFWGQHYQKQKAAGLLLEIDFPIRPKSRNMLLTSPHMQRLRDQFVARRDEFRDVLAGFSRAYIADLLNIRADEPEESPEPRWMQQWLPGLDGAALYAFTAHRNPAIFLEVGSGNSTKFVRRAISDHNLRTKIISIDPYPRAEVDAICDDVIRVPFEDVDQSITDRLTSSDIVFIDNSHRSFSNSDVTVFFMEMQGRLPKGCLYGVHDIFLPYDYPEGWSDRFYQEQYLLASYLFGGADGDTVVLPAAWVSRDPDALSGLHLLWQALPQGRDHGGAFWMMKG